MRSAPAQFAVLETVQQALLQQAPDLRKQARRLSSGFIAGASRLRSASASPAPVSSDAQAAAGWDSDADDDDEDWPALEEIGVDQQSAVAATPTLSRWTDASGRRLLVLGYGADVHVWDASGDLEAMSEVAFVKAPCGSGAVIVDAALAANALELLLLCVRTPLLLLTAQRIRREEADELDHRLLARLAYCRTASQAQWSRDAAQGQREPRRRRTSYGGFSALTEQGCAALDTPAAIHLLDAATLKPLSLGPITSHLALHPTTGAPVFDLGRSRLLTYATTRTLPADRGANIIAGGAWATTFGPGPGLAARAAGQVARGVYSGVRAIGDLGLAYFAPHPSSSSYSRSAPAATPTSSTSSVPSFGPPPSAAGHVLVVDLKSMETSRGRQRPRVVAHFRPSRQPIALLSLSPSGALVLSSSIEAHTFHVCELRPRGGDGGVRHRYELARGLTNGSPEAVRWSDDARFVAVSMAKGTTRASPLPWRMR